MTMTVSDLRSLLEHYPGDMPVMIAHQPNWPLAEALAGVASHDGRVDDVDCPEHDGWLVGHAGCDVTADDEPDDDARTLWLVAGGHQYDRSPYAPRWAFDQAGVSR